MRSLLLLSLFVVSQQTPSVNPTDDIGLDVDRWKLTWSDEFDGKRNERPDKKKWVLETGGHGWGNDELQTYTDRRRNVRLDGKGNLLIEVHEEKLRGKDGRLRSYTSGRLKTLGLFSQKYGRISARIKIPTGKGLWCAFWTLGEDFPKAGWPRCGEIDIMENVGHETRTVHGTLHGPGYSGARSLGKKFEIEEVLHESFHVFTVEWTEDTIEWFVDGKSYHKRTKADLKNKPWMYDKPHFILLNVAVGGHWPGSPNDKTKFPQRMLVDWVRVYRDK